MAIVIKKDNIFGIPDINVITDNKINKINYNRSLISKISQLGIEEPNLKWEKIFSKNVICWKMNDDSTHYEYNLGKKDDGVELIRTIYNNKTEYSVNIDMNKIKSNFFYRVKSPISYAYVQITYNLSAFNTISNTSSGVGQNFWLSSSITTNDENKISWSSDTRSNNNMYTKTTSFTQQELFYLGSTNVIEPFLLFNPNSDTTSFDDEFNGKLIVRVGTINGIDASVSNVSGQAVIDFNIDFYYPSFQLEQNNEVVGTGNNEFVMETNTLMNEYKIEDNSTPTTYFKNQASIIVSDYLLGKVVANISVNYGKYYNDDGTVAYSGNDGKTIKVGDEVSLELENVNKVFTVNKSEIVYSGNTLINLTLEEKLVNFEINQSIGNGASVVYTRTSSPRGLSTGVISSTTKLYAGDVIKIDLTLDSDKYLLSNFIVEGSSFTSGQSITISSDLDVNIATTPKPYILSLDLGSNLASYSIKRTSSPIGNASVGTQLTNNSIIYYNDVISISSTPNTGYSTKLYINNVQSNVNEIIVTNNTSIKIESNLITAILGTSQISVGVNYTITRTSSPLGNGSIGNITTGATLYYNDVIKIVFSAQSGYTVGNAVINGIVINSGDSITINNGYINEYGRVDIYIVATQSAKWRTVWSGNYTWECNTSSGELLEEMMSYNGIRDNVPTKVIANITYKEFNYDMETKKINLLNTCCGIGGYEGIGNRFDSKENDYAINDELFVMGIRTPTTENRIEFYAKGRTSVAGEELAYSIELLEIQQYY